MLKKMVNEAFCTLQITTTGPLLVKSGHASISGPDMTPVAQWQTGGVSAWKLAQGRLSQSPRKDRVQPEAARGLLPV